MSRLRSPARPVAGTLAGLAMLATFVSAALAAETKRDASSETGESAPALALPEATVGLEPTELLVGDRVVATISVPVDDGTANPVFPDWSNGWGDAEVVEAGPVRIEEVPEGRAAVQRLTLTAFRTGSVPLPPVEIRRGDEAAFRTPAALALEVRSVLAADDRELAPAPPAPPRRLPVSPSVFWALGGAALLALVAGVVVYRRRYDRDPLAAPALPPMGELERALGLLAAQAEKSPEAAFRGLSHAFRRYLGRAFGFHALESTTTELQRRLGERGVGRELVRRAIATLRLADQVKFARRPAAAPEAAERIAETRALAGELEALLAPREVAGDAAAAPASVGKGAA